jgi:hypothetical protein
VGTHRHSSHRKHFPRRTRKPRVRWFALENHRDRTRRCPTAGIQHR